MKKVKSNVVGDELFPSKIEKKKLLLRPPNLNN